MGQSPGLDRKPESLAEAVFPGAGLQRLEPAERILRIGEFGVVSSRGEIEGGEESAGRVQAQGARAVLETCGK